MLNYFVIPQLSLTYLFNFNRFKWTQDGVPPHHNNNVRQSLYEISDDRILALNHRMERPARSPDLTPYDFFLWGYLKSRVFTSLPQGMKVLRQRIIAQVNDL